MKTSPFIGTKILALCGALLLPSALLHAQTTATWNPGTGLWSTPTNWTPNGVPNTSLYDVYIDGGNVVASAVTFNSDLTVGRITIDLGDSLTVNPNTWLTLEGGGFAGSGALIVNGFMALNGGSLLRLGETGNQTFTLSGTGSLDLGGAIIASSGSGNILQNNLSIVGSGNIGAANFNIVNSGSITAQNGGTMTLQPVATFANTGTVTASAGSVVAFGDGAYTNTGHTMTATGAGAQLHFNSNATLKGGTLEGVSGGEIYLHSDGVVLDGATNGALTLKGATRIAGNYLPTFVGTITNDGTITAEGGSYFRVGDTAGQTVILNGSGSFAMSGSLFGSNFNGNVLDSSIPISGSGNIGGNSINFINRSSVTATGTMALDPLTTFTNLGTVTASGVIINFEPGTYENAGHVMTATGAGAQLHFNSNATLKGGTLEGVSGGEIYLHSDGVVLDGATNGALTLKGATRIAGNYLPTFVGTITNDGTITAEGGSYFRVGDTAGQTVILNGSGSFAMSGSLFGSNFNGNVLDSSIPISGSGNIGGNSINFINRSSVTATGTMALDPLTTFTNLGTVTASGVIINFEPGTYENAGHVMTATGAGAQLHFNSNATLKGGTLEGVSGGEIYLHSDGVVLDGATNGPLLLQGATRIASAYTPTFIGTITNDGTITAEGSSTFRAGDATGQTVILNGSGSLVMNGAILATSFNNNVLDSFIPISGSGNIGQNSMNFINHSSVTATGTMNFEAFTTFTNLGTVTASGAIINFGGGAFFGGGTYENAGHVMTATGAGAQLHFNSNATLKGGTLEGVSGGEIYLHSDGVVLDGATDGALTLKGATRIASAYIPTFIGSIINEGTINAESGSLFRVGNGNGQTTQLYGNFSSELVLNNSTILSSFSGNLFANEIGHTIRGTGTIGAGTINLRNSGTIGGGAGALTVSPAATFSNFGGNFGSTVQASGGGSVTFTSGAITNDFGGRFVADTSGSINLTGSATLTNYAAGTLTDGSYEIIGGGVMNLGIGAITTNAARVILDGASASFTPIDTVAVNSTGGELAIKNGRNFTTVGGLSNAGTISVGNTSTFTVPGAFSNPGTVRVDPGGAFVATASPLPQYDSGTQTLSGTYIAGGPIKLNIGNIQHVAGAIYLNDNAGLLLKPNNESANAITSVEAGGTLGLSNVYYTWFTDLTNSGTLQIGSGYYSAGLHLQGGNLIQNSGTTRLEYGSVTSITDITIAGGTLEGTGTLQPGGATPTVTVGGTLRPASPFYGDYGEGKIDVVGRLSLGNDSTYLWSLTPYFLLDNSSENGAGNWWDLVTTTQGAFGGPVDFTIDSTVNPNSGNLFWQSDHSWDVLIAQSGGINASFNLTNSTFDDGSFNLSTNTEGGVATMTLNYNANAVPEPTLTVLLGCGALVLWGRRRRVTT